MQFSHIVIGCAAWTGGDESYGILEGHREVSAESMGLQAACLDNFICLYKDLGDLKAMLPV